MEINIYGIFALAAGVSAVFFGLVVYIRNRKDLVNKTFALLSVGFSMWTFSYFIWLLQDTAESALFWSRMLNLGATLIPPFYLHWILSFLGLNKKRKWIILFAYLITIFFAIFSFSPLYIKEVKPILGFPYWPQAGILYSVFLFFSFFALDGYALVELIRQHSKAGREKKIQIKYLIGATAIGFGGGITNFPLMYGVPLMLPYGMFLIVFYPFLLYYAVAKHHLFNVRVIATEFFTFAIWLTLLARMLLSENVQDFALNSIILVAVLFFGVLVIRSVLKEVQQKERIERAKVEDEALLGSIGDGVIAIDKQGDVMFVNRAAEQILGFNSEQAIDKPYGKILEVQNEKGEVLTDGRNPLEQALNSGKKIITDATGTPEKTIYFVRSDKTKFPAAITVAPVVLQGQTIGAINVFRDITVERQIDKSKSEFVSLASHQLRTPLTTIKWYAEMLLDSKKSGKLTPKQKEYLNVIYEGDMRMVRLVDIMLDVSRLDAGKIKLREEKVDIAKVAKIIIEEEKPNIKKLKQTFEFNCEEKKPETLTDQNQLRIVFQNVISNAVKYTPTGGKIVCTIKREGGNFLFSVKDNGIGIPRDQQKKIFGKLFRADNAFSHEPDGNGLGLYAAKATIENLGGKIWFESPSSAPSSDKASAGKEATAGKQEGKGTTFFVTIPIKN